MKIEIIDNNTIAIDDGKFVLTKDVFGQYKLGLGDGIIPTNLVQADPEPDYEPRIDPHHYINHNSNGLTVDESTERAVAKVYWETWDSISADDIGDINLLREVIRTMVVEGQGRNAVYALAGGIKKGWSNGYYEGVPLAWVMKGYLDGHISMEGKAFPQGTPTQNQAESLADFIYGRGR